VVREVVVGAGDGFAAGQVLSLEARAVCRQDEFSLRFGGRGAFPEGREGFRDLSGATGSDVDITSLKNSAKIRLVGGPRPQPLDRCLLVAKSFQEGIREVRGIKRLIRQLRNGFFYFNCVQLLASL